MFRRGGGEAWKRANIALPRLSILLKTPLAKPSNMRCSEYFKIAYSTKAFCRLALADTADRVSLTIASNTLVSPALRQILDGRLVTDRLRIQSHQIEELRWNVRPYRQS